MLPTLRLAAAVLAVLCPVITASAETVRVVTYNIENFRFAFDGTRGAATRPSTDALAGLTPDQRDILSREARDDREEQWEVASVIRHPAVNPDVLMIQESATAEDLETFNKAWLDEAYTVTQFPTNTNSDRGQHLTMLLRKGFKVVDHVYLFEDKDPTADGKVPDEASTPRVDIGADPDSRKGRIFARGPAFVLIETPGGYRLWVGNTHQKSKSGNSVEVTKWRNREAARTLEVMKQLREKGPADVLLVGDYNDALGVQQYENEGGGDTIANMTADPAFVLLTKSLAETPDAKSFGGYWSNRGNVIDHGLASKELAPKVTDVSIFDKGLAPVASDHFPVVFVIDTAAPQAAEK